LSADITPLFSLIRLLPPRLLMLMRAMLPLITFIFADAIIFDYAMPFR